MIDVIKFERLCNEIQSANDLVTLGAIMSDICALTGYTDELSADRMLAYLLGCQTLDYENLSMIVDLFERCQARLEKLQQIAAN